MQLIGMLDSPFVRRVAITMELLAPPTSTAASFPALADYSARAELLPAFIATPPL